MNKIPLLLRIILAVVIFLICSALIYEFTQDAAFAFTLGIFIAWIASLIIYIVGAEKEKDRKDEATYVYTCFDLGTFTIVIENKEDEEASDE